MKRPMTEFPLDFDALRQGEGSLVSISADMQEQILQAVWQDIRRKENLRAEKTGRRVGVDEAAI